jgi:predicted flap endonuclease-1-like 5' DNA nuclease
MDPISERLLWFVLGFLSGGLTIGGIVARRLRRPAPDDAAAAFAAPAAAGDSPHAHAPDREALPETEYPHMPGPARLIDVGAARAAGFNLKHAEDLTIVEGIGPKIEDLLRANGIHGFAQLASLDEGELLRILDRGGASFRFANPEHWAREAALAAENRWKELKRLQDERIEGAKRPD